ncbi:MAG: hypothetical protein KAV82_14800 [Phycisphaerae bacterium]|nr:hypothetical protein [Phycisphaerae bacterium]
MRKTMLLLLAVSTLWFLTGCAHTGGAAERFGKTYYLDGAGNWGFGSGEVSRGLKQAGYRGDVEVFLWTMTLNPLADQLNYLGARMRAAKLADRIARYHRKYPHNKINLIALSAGTGVATWAIEKLPSDVKIDTLVLLGSSLSHDYDMTKVLDHMAGKIYAYYSPHDTVLQAVKIIGTIDQKRGVDSIGLVGLQPVHGHGNRIVNIAWSRRWLKLGWAGAHTDCTNQVFVRYEIAPRLLPSASTQVAAAAPFDAQDSQSISAVAIPRKH